LATPELRVVDVVKKYSPSVSVGPITFDVYPGECLSLLGPSGCGKTTILRSIAGLERISAGAIYLGDSRLDLVPPHKRGVGLVFQQYALFPHLSIFDNIAFGLRLARVDRQDIKRRVSAMLEMVDLEQTAARFPHEISGGQQQRVAIARALVREPRLILFDEPLSNLDLKLRIKMRQELRDLQRRLGKTTIYVTHDQTEALALSDRVAVLSQGHIEQVGVSREIYERPATPFVADFIGNANLLPCQIVDRAPGRLTAIVDPDLRFIAEADGEKHDGRRLLMLRPECLHLGQDGEQLSDAENCHPGRITDITYLGDSISVIVRIRDRLDLVVAAKTNFHNKAFSIGQTVMVGISAADIHVLAP
jgi:spermidine/putrescine ABC transporter ATP-binding subunit